MEVLVYLACLTTALFLTAVHVCHCTAITSLTCVPTLRLDNTAASGDTVVLETLQVDNIDGCALRCCETDGCEMAALVSSDCKLLKCEPTGLCQKISTQGSTLVIFSQHYAPIRSKRDTNDSAETQDSPSATEKPTENKDTGGTSTPSPTDAPTVPQAATSTELDKALDSPQPEAASNEQSEQNGTTEQATVPNDTPETPVPTEKTTPVPTEKPTPVPTEQPTPAPTEKPTPTEKPPQSTTPESSGLSAETETSESTEKPTTQAATEETPTSTETPTTEETSTPQTITTGTEETAPEETVSVETTTAEKPAATTEASAPVETTTHPSTEVKTETPAPTETPPPEDTTPSPTEATTAVDTETSEESSGNKSLSTPQTQPSDNSSGVTGSFNVTASATTFTAENDNSTSADVLDTTPTPFENETLSANETLVAANILAGDRAMSAALIAALSFGILFFAAVVVLLSKRAYDGWKRRHYSRVDYLVNGMYN